MRVADTREAPPNAAALARELPRVALETGIREVAGDLRLAILERLEDGPPGELADEEQEDQEPDDLRQDLGLDSVDMVTLLIEVQSQFQIIVPTEDLVNLKTVANLLDHLYPQLSSVRKAA